MKEEDDQFRVIETTATDRVTEVRFYESTAEHIESEHPEFPYLPCVDGAVDGALAQPHRVYESNPPHVNSFKYVSEDTTFSGNPMVVAVKVIEGTSALVKTVYFPDAVSGKLIWSKDGG